MRYALVNVGPPARGVVAALVAIAAAHPAAAGITIFQSFADWQAATPDGHSTCDFTGFAPNTIITEQYADLGIHFVNPFNLVHNIPSLFPQDGWGIDPNGVLEVKFDGPMHAIAAHSPSSQWKYKLYLGDALVGQFPAQTAGPEQFLGVTTAFAFDRVRFLLGGDFGIIWTDNIYFATVPAPAAMPVLLMLGLVAPGLRRRIDLCRHRVCPP